MSKFHYFLPGLHKCAHNAYAGPFIIQAIPCSQTVHSLHQLALHMILSMPVCVKGLKYKSQIHVQIMCRAHVGSTPAQEAPEAAFDVDVKLPSHLSPHLSSASRCSPFLSIRLLFFLPSSLSLFPSLTPTLSQQVIH